MAILNSPTLSGDISGTIYAITVDKIKGYPVSSTPPTAGQTLLYSGTGGWTPTTTTPVTEFLPLSGGTMRGAISGPGGGNWTAKFDSKNWTGIAVSQDGQYQIACATSLTEGDYIYNSADFGNTWTARNTQAILSYSSVAISSGGNIQTAVVSNSAIFVSSNFGATWSKRGIDRDWRSIAISSNGAVQLAGAFNDYLYVSTDEGLTWQARSLDSPKNWLDLSMSDNGIIQAAVVYGGQIYVSTNTGTSWSAKDQNRNWVDVSVSSNGVIQVAVVEDGQLYISTDTGNTWTANNTAGSRIWQSVSISGDGTKITAVATGMGGDYIYFSADSGATWTAKGPAQFWYATAISKNGLVQAAAGYPSNLYVSRPITVVADVDGLTVVGNISSTAAIFAPAFSGDGSDLTNLTIGNFLSSSGGSLTGGLTGTNAVFTSLSATKLYGDGSSLTGITGGNGTTGNYLSASGGTLTGGLTGTEAVFTSLSATKLYGDGSSLTGIAAGTTGNYLSASGGTLTGGLTGTEAVFTSLSAVTLYGDGSNLTGIGTTTGSYLSTGGGIMTGPIRFADGYGPRLDQGRFDTSRGGLSGISLVCSVDFDFNWQAGWLAVFNQDRVTPIPFFIDSGAGTSLKIWNGGYAGSGNTGGSGIELSHESITFPDNTIQTTAFIPANTLSAGGGTLTGGLTGTNAVFNTLSASMLYGNGSNLTNLTIGNYLSSTGGTLTGGLTGTEAVFASISGTKLYGDGSSLTGLTIGSYLSTGGGTVSGNATVIGNFTITGDLSCKGTQHFTNTVFSTTSSISVVNITPLDIPALYVGQDGIGDIASFYDLDTGIEVLHVGGDNGTFPNVGVKTSTPNKTLTVNGEISANNTIWDSNGNSNNWNSVYSTVRSISSTQYLYLTGGTLTGGLTGTNAVFASVSGTKLYGDGSSLTGLTVGNYLSSAGGTLTGGLTGTNAVFASISGTKLYGDGSSLTGLTVGNYLSSAGGTLTGGLTGTNAVFTSVSGTKLYGDGSSLTGLTVGNYLSSGGGTLTGGVTGTNAVFTTLSASMLYGNGSNLTNLTIGNYLSSAGGTLTGGLTGTNAVFTSVSATKFYGDGSSLTGITGGTAGNYLSASGGTLTGGLTAAAGTATLVPITFQAGTITTSPLAHAMEWDGSQLYTTTSAQVRRKVSYIDETVTIINAAANSQTNSFLAETQEIHYYTVAATGNFTINVVGNTSPSKTYDSIAPVNSSRTVCIINTSGNTAYVPIFQIDGVTQTVKWQGNQTTGTANALDVWTFTIIETAAATYTVLGSVSMYL